MTSVVRFVKELNWVRCLMTKQQKPWAERSRPPVRTLMKPGNQRCLRGRRQTYHRNGEIGRALIRTS
jgi:hypothetical protein